MNSLERMSFIFSSFDFMTTNSIGSHVVYAAYSGCKVSIYGKYLNFNRDDYRNDIYYKIHPDVLEYILEFNKEENVKNRYPFLFTEPKKASFNYQWALKELGVKHKKNYDEIYSYLDTSFYRHLKGYLYTITNIVSDKKMLSNYIKTAYWKFTNGCRALCV